MSRKTKLYVEPGTVLNWDNEIHRPYIEEEAFAEFDKHPKPTRKGLPKSRWWWFWRAFGMFLYMPARWVLHSYLNYSWSNSRSEYRWPGAQSLDKWIHRGSTKGPRAFWLRKVLYWIADRNAYSQCLTCGNDEYHDEIEINGITLDMFEHLEGGGVDYWGEGQDAYGWMWCYRCGSVSWEAA